MRAFLLAASSLALALQTPSSTAPRLVLEPGDMNGMRPRGMLLHEGRREGDVLTGTVRFGGIRFVPPDGHEHPTPHFELRKKDRP